MEQYETSNEVALTIPGYAVFERIGQGGTGTVYRAMQLSLSRMVALKVLHRSGAGETPSAFQRESRLMASLSHPNIVAIHDTGRAGEYSYLVTELIQGQSLRVAMSPGQPWTVRRALPVLDGIAAALSYIHGQGILHLDLKPENVLCPEGRDVKIADFGLALQQVDARQLAERGLAQGTMDYCAPEQRHGLKTDPRSDLFSFAVVAYELLTGQVPPRTFQPPSQLNPKLPKAVDGVFQPGLARKVHDRYETVEKFHRELRQALRPPKFTGPQLGVLCAMVLLALWLGVGLVRSLGPAPEPPVRVWLIHDEPATLSFFQAEGEKALAEAIRDVPVESLYAGSLAAGERIHAELPLNPLPLPVMVIRSKGSLGFYHPYKASRLGEKFFRQWDQLMDLPPVPSEANLLKSGGFEGDCLSTDVKSGIWRLRSATTFTAGVESISVEEPSDRPGNPALLLSRKSFPSASVRDLGLFQNLPNPETSKPMVLRFRARAEEGEPRLSIGPRYSLLIPHADRSPLAGHLRSATLAHKFVPSTSDAEARDYWAVNWFTPTREWRTYILVWERPPFDGGWRGRNLEIIFAGLGKAWLDDLELFTWE